MGMSENSLLAENMRMISEQKSEKNVIAYAKRDTRFWPFHFGTMPQEKGAESFSLTKKEKWTTFVGSVLFPASLWAIGEIEKYFINNASVENLIVGKEVPLAVELTVPVAALVAFFMLVSGPVGALQRLREQRLINWWQTNKIEQAIEEKS
jgi:hypothetical protein